MRGRIASGWAWEKQGSWSVYHATTPRQQRRRAREGAMRGVTTARGTHTWGAVRAAGEGTRAVPKQHRQPPRPAQPGQQAAVSCARGVVRGGPPPQVGGEGLGPQETVDGQHFLRHQHAFLPVPPSRGRGGGGGLVGPQCQLVVHQVHKVGIVAHLPPRARQRVIWGQGENE